jgi:IS1 family transposase
MFDHPVFFILPLFMRLIQNCIGLALFLIAVRFPSTPVHEDKKRCLTASGYPTKKPECPACEKDGTPTPRPETPPIIVSHYGRPRCVDTSVHYCPNTDCSYYGWLGLRNIISNGHPNGGNWRQLQCVVCEKYFMETIGTIFYGNRTAPETIWMALSAMAEGLSIRSTARVFRVDKDTVQHWLNQASEHMETVSRYLFHNLDLTQVQVDELWALMGRRQKKHERNSRWVWAALDPVNKLFLSFVVGDRSLGTAQLLIHDVVQILGPGCVPLFTSDGWAPYAIALLTHFGYWCKTPRKSKYGPTPSPRWKPLPILHYVQVVKRRVNGRVVGVSHRLVYGSLAMAKGILSQAGVNINTAFIERLNLSIRQHISALGRKVISLAKTQSGLTAQVNVYQAYYNLCLPHSSLRLPLPEAQGETSRKWSQRTPAMAAGVTENIWRMEDLLLFRAPPWHQPVPERRAA